MIYFSAQCGHAVGWVSFCNPFLSGPEQQGCCEEGDCQEAAVDGGS